MRSSAGLPTGLFAPTAAAMAASNYQSPAAALFVDQTNRAAQMAFHRDYPFAVNSSPKAVKAQAYGWLNAIHYLAPADTSGISVCPKASAGCKDLCLGWFSGQAGIGDDNSTRRSRLDKTRRFMHDRKAYLADIVRQIERQQRLAAKRGFKLCVRLNGSSDIAWEGIRLEDGRSLFERFPDVAFVDYTKIARRFDRALPPNYHLTLSRSETNEGECIAALERGINVAIVFADKPAAWHGFEFRDYRKRARASPRDQGILEILERSRL
jgi:hypothetical protein